MLRKGILSFLVMTVVASVTPARSFGQSSGQNSLPTGDALPTESGMTSTTKPAEFEGIGIDEKLGTPLDLSLQVRDESGALVPLQKYFDGKKPVMLSLVYFSCPGLCNYHLNGLTEGMKQMEWKPGQDFEVLSMSFDPKENSEMAAKKKANYLKLYGHPEAASGWHFLTADAETIKKITETVGFKYKWDAKNNDWAHASAAIVLSPEGKISRYLHGIIFEPRDVKLALMDAIHGKTSSIADRLVWYCFQYDEHKSKYSFMVFRVLQIGGGLFALILGALLMLFYLRSKREGAKA